MSSKLFSIESNLLASIRKINVNKLFDKYLLKKNLENWAKRF